MDSTSDEAGSTGDGTTGITDGDGTTGISDSDGTTRIPAGDATTGIPDDGGTTGIPDGDGIGAVDLDATTTVVVPTGGGERFHRTGVFLFETACRTDFDHDVRETSVSGAVRDGFTRCRKPACFGGSIE